MDGLSHEAGGSGSDVSIIDASEAVEIVYSVVVENMDEVGTKSGEIVLMDQLEHSSISVSQTLLVVLNRLGWKLL